MDLQKLNKIAEQMVAGNKGLLAADESSGTIKRRFDTIKLESTESNRRDYREMLFTADGIGRYISGVILYDETIRQKAKDGTPLVEILRKNGVLPGIKVDAGTKPLPGSPEEKITEGLDGLSERVAEYVKLGASFAKWRAVIDIGPGIPTDYCIRTNAHALARYARICQEGGLVPIVEPEVLMDGGHDIDTCNTVTERTLFEVFRELQLQGVALEGMILKPNMVIAGQKCPKQASPHEVAELTIKCLKSTVPAAVPGIAFLSGGQSDEQATQNLSLMNKIGTVPWKLTFSYGRALQAAALKAWGGRAENVAAGQRAFTHRSKMNSLAALGKWSGELEKAA